MITLTDTTLMNGMTPRIPPGTGGPVTPSETRCPPMRSPITAMTIMTRKPGDHSHCPTHGLLPILEIHRSVKRTRSPESCQHDSQDLG